LFLAAGLWSPVEAQPVLAQGFTFTASTFAPLIEAVPEPYRAAILASPADFLKEYQVLLGAPADQLVLGPILNLTFFAAVAHRDRARAGRAHLDTNQVATEGAKNRRRTFAKFVDLLQIIEGLKQVVAIYQDRPIVQSPALSDSHSGDWRKWCLHEFDSVLKRAKF
jgi:hypothetical protein